MVIAARNLWNLYETDTNVVTTNDNVPIVATKAAIMVSDLRGGKYNADRAPKTITNKKGKSKYNYFLKLFSDKKFPALGLINTF